MKRYEFKLVIAGYGDTVEEAWEDACEGFSLDDEGVPDESEYEITEDDEEEGELDLDNSTE